MPNVTRCRSDVDYTITSVQRALEILKLFMPANHPLSQQEICQQTGMNKSTVLRMVYTLEGCGFLKADPQSKRYSLGTTSMQIGLAALDSLSYVKTADPILHKLSNETGFVSHLGIFESNNVVVIAKTFPDDHPFSIRLQSTVGGILPTYCTGIGLLFLSQERDETVREILEGFNRVRYTSTTETDVDRILERIQDIRQKGWVMNNGEHDEGIVSICCPIFDHTRKMVMGMSLGGIREVVFRQDLDKLRKTALQAAKQISWELGYYG